MIKSNRFWRTLAACVALISAGSSIFAEPPAPESAELPPVAVTSNPVAVAGDSATLVGAVNPSGLMVGVRFEYGLTDLYGRTTPVQYFPAGDSLIDVLAPITNLYETANYHYRLIATTSAGISYGEDVVFQADAGVNMGTGMPSAAPSVTTGGFAGLGAESVELLGSTNPHGGTTVVQFEFGATIDYGQTSELLGIGNDDLDAAVSLTAEDLLPGTLYHYRLIATNSQGTTQGADATFTTNFLPPTVATESASAISTTSASIVGSVRARNAESQVFIDYGTDPEMLDSTVAASPALVSGDAVTSVSGDLPNLSQGTTYYYQVRAENSGGTGLGEVNAFDVGLLSGLFHLFPDLILAEDRQASVRIDLSPSGIGGGWRFAGEQLWRASGDTATGLVRGDRVVEFRPTPGYLQPSDEVVVSGDSPVVLDRSYTASGAPGSGGLMVTLKPESLSDAGVPVANRAQWRLFGETDDEWRDSDATATDLVPGDYVIECKPVAGRTTPSVVSAVVFDGATTSTAITYFITGDAVGAAPAVLTFDTLSTREDRPFAYVGQITSDIGASTGFVVRPKVVATAGHVVFDDGTLATTTGLHWLFQRDSGVHEPARLVPRGFYLMSGYAAQRALDNSPGSSTPDSQNLDAAALYFLEDAGRSGFSGYLASDLPVNEFLVSSSLKTLVGYPVNGIAADDQGRMHATPLADVDFASAFGQTYTTSDIHSSGGNSGGPLCIQHESGVFYPAAIYLGGTAQTVVRAIDGDVVDLFGFADATADADVSGTGGALTQNDKTPIANPDLGSLKVIIEPAAARSAGAGWRIQAQSDYLPSAAQIDELSSNNYTVRFSTVSGFVPPTSQPVTVDVGKLTTITFTYSEIIQAPDIDSPASQMVTRGESLNYQISATNSPAFFTLVGGLPEGASFDEDSGLISGTTQESGVFPVTVGAVNSGGADSQVVNLTIRPELIDQSLTAPYELALSYQIISSESGGGLTYTASDLPSGLSLAASTGLITGVPTQPGIFEVPISVMRNGASESATLTITITGEAPVITQQPVSAKTVEVGLTTTLTVAASGIPAPSFQWYEGSSGDTSSPIAGATSATFTTPVVEGSTSYWARASNLGGSADSNHSAISSFPSSLARLASLTTSAGELTPGFNPGIFSYSITVPYSTNSINVTTTVQASDSAVYIDEVPQELGIPSSEIFLQPGFATTVYIEVFPGDRERNSAFYLLDVLRLPEPQVTTLDPVGVSDNAATLSGLIVPNGPAVVYFEYSDSEAYDQVTEKQFVSGTKDLQIEASLTGLQGSSFYLYRIVAETSEGIIYGDGMSFFTDRAPPLAATGSPAGVSPTQATLIGAVNPRGYDGNTYFEYGSTESFGMTMSGRIGMRTSGRNVPGTDGVMDYLEVITGLIEGNTYYYRIVAEHTDEGSSGPQYGETVSFVAVTGSGGGDGIVDDVPTVTTGSAVDITTNSAVLQAIVNPNDGTTFVYFEYGQSDYYGSTSATIGIGNGIQAANVTLDVAGLVPGADYHYRIVASNSLGTSFGEDATFNASFPAPIVSTGGASALSSTSVNLTGSVRARGTTADVWFDYGTDALSFPNSILASEMTVHGDLEMPVNVDLTNLDRTLIYYYRIRAESSDGGVGLGETRQLQIGALLGLEQTFPRAVRYNESSGEVVVNMLPPKLGGWRFEGETKWRPSGVPVTGLTTSQREVIFQPVAGYIQPRQETIGVVSGEPSVVLDRIYYQAAAPGSGTMKVLLEPETLAGAGVPVENRLQWRLLGANDTVWRNSGDEIAGLVAGSYLVECKAVSGKNSPPPVNYLIRDAETTTAAIAYRPASAPTLNPPAAIPFVTVAGSEALPYAYVGQVRSGTGLFSGFVVKPRVVATVAQAVFDDATLAATSGTQWLLQRDQGNYEPTPQIPRGYYLFTGYDSRRALEDTPGTLSIESQNLNVAALYFPEDAGRGGFSGFLASDEEDNVFLQSMDEKILVGYPVNGIAAVNQGRTHATPISTASLSLALGRTFTSPAIRGVGGMSGGPLCVRYRGGGYYPAGIYVGGVDQGAVRAIDRDVIDLLTRAEISANGGDNNTGGGITHSSFVSFGNPTLPAALRVTIEPEAARNAGAGWQLVPESTLRPSGAQKSGLAPGSYTLRFTSVTGFPAPADQTVVVSGGQLTNITVSYAVETTDLEVWRFDHFGTISNAGDAADDADPDNDNQTNIEEYAAGTNPNDPKDVFKVVSTSLTGGAFTATVAGKAGRTYILQRRTSLSSGSWSNVRIVGPLPSDATTPLSDTAAPAGSAFYQIVVTFP